MKKLITLLTATSFSLVPTVNIIACQNNKAEEEIVGETIEQEIVDGAIEELNSFWVGPPINIKYILDNSDIKKLVSDIEKNPEYLIMEWILIKGSDFVTKPGNNKSNIANLKVDFNIKRTDLIKQNFRKFKVMPVEETWFENLKNSTDGSEKECRFKLKFGKTLSKNSIKINLYWH